MESGVKAGEQNYHERNQRCFDESFHMHYFSDRRFIIPPRTSNLIPIFHPLKTTTNQPYVHHDIHTFEKPPMQEKKFGINYRRIYLSSLRDSSIRIFLFFLMSFFPFHHFLFVSFWWVASVNTSFYLLGMPRPLPRTALWAAPGGRPRWGACGCWDSSFSVFEGG